MIASMHACTRHARNANSCASTEGRNDEAEIVSEQLNMPYIRGPKSKSYVRPAEQPTGECCGTCGAPWREHACSALHADVYKAYRRFMLKELRAIAAFQTARRLKQSWDGVLPWQQAHWCVQSLFGDGFSGRLFLPVWIEKTAIDYRTPYHVAYGVTAAETRDNLVKMAAESYGCPLADTPTTT